jgi:ribonuclease PH
MNLITKQQIDIDIANIEASATTFLNAINAAIHSLNNSHQVFWNLPDDRLTAVLQKLYDHDQLLSLFANHEYSAKALNEIKSRANSEGVVAIAVAAREFEIVDGVVSLIIKPVIEPEVIIEEPDHMV